MFANLKKLFTRAPLSKPAAPVAFVSVSEASVDLVGEAIRLDVFTAVRCAYGFERGALAVYTSGAVYDMAHRNARVELPALAVAF